MVGIDLTELAAALTVFAVVAALAVPWRRVASLLWRRVSTAPQRNGRRSATLYSLADVAPARPISFGRSKKVAAPISEPGKPDGVDPEPAATPRGRRRKSPLSLPPARRSVVLGAVDVVDGDTLKDRATGVTYRVANIDAPETGSNARCYAERKKGEEARAEAAGFLKHAKSKEARLIGRTDKYGRAIALIIVDGQDLGARLIQKGLARPWTGQRERWCGAHGALLQMARETSTEWSCRNCKQANTCPTPMPAANNSLPLLAQEARKRAEGPCKG